MLPKGVTEIDLENPGERFMRDNELDTSSYEVRGRDSVRELGSPLSHSCDRPPIPWGRRPRREGERQAAQGPPVVRSMDGDSPELVVKAKPAGPTTWERNIPGQRA